MASSNVSLNPLQLRPRPKAQPREGSLAASLAGPPPTFAAPSPPELLPLPTEATEELPVSATVPPPPIHIPRDPGGDSPGTQWEPPPRAPLPRPPAPSADPPLYESLLLFCVIALGAYVGVFLRIGFGYYKVNAVLYANVAGSAFLGFASEWQLALMAGPRLHRLLYVFIATGVCGSLTTFSTAQGDASRLVIIQSDTSYGSIGLNYHWGRVFEYVMALWGSFLLPLAALQGGKHAAQAWIAAGKESADAGAEKVFSAAVATAGIVHPPPNWHGRVEAVLCLLYAAATAAVIALPTLYGWSAFAYAGILGSLGAYARYRLSAWNKRAPEWCYMRSCVRLARACGGDAIGVIPLGTLAANLLGTWIFAATFSSARFLVSYHAMATHDALYGVATGFCGCLTTMSTFVLELHTLHRSRGYAYTLLSLGIAQLGWAVLWQAEAATLARNALGSAISPRIYPCQHYPILCTALLSSIGCPNANATNSACVSVEAAPSAFAGTCRCGAFTASERLGKLVVDAQALMNVSSSLVPTWTSPVDGIPRQPLEAIDFCGSFENLCDHALNALSCPAVDRRLDACSRRGLPSFRGLCACGSWDLMGVGDGVNGRVAELMIDHLLLRRYDLASTRGFATAALPIDYCAAVQGACDSYLEHIMCPPQQRASLACATARNYSTFVGTCECFGVRGPATNQIPKTVLDAFVKPNLFPRLTRRGTNSSIDACASFAGVCDYVQDAVGCPLELRAGTTACDAGDASAGPPPPNATANPAAFIGMCLCGAPDSAMSKLLSMRVRDYVIDGVVAETLERYVLRPPPVTAFALMAASSPFRPILTPRYPLPGNNYL